jgi:hypothetical protein
MGLPLQLRTLLIVGAALSAFPAIAMADPTQDPSSIGDRSVMTRPSSTAAAPAAAPAPLDLPAPATVVQTNAAAAEGFKDVPANHWAYPALQQLQADGIVLGYPDGTFRGKRPITRYELAAITARAIKHVQELLANAATAPKVSPDDIATLRKLIDDNTTQLAAVQKDVDVLKKQTALNTATLNRQQFHLYYSLRAPGTVTDRVSAYNSATGLALPSGTKLTGPNMGLEGPQTLNSGLTSHGTGYQILRMIYSGDVDSKVAYAVRLEDRMYLDNTSINGGLGGDSTSSFTPSASGSFPNNGVLRINYATVKYTDPSGFYARAGRFVEGSGDIGLLFSDYFNGGEVGFNKGKVQGFVGYSFNKAAVSNTTLPAGTLQSSQTLLGRIGTPLGTKAELGLNYINDVNLYAANPTTPNPVTGILTSYRQPISAGSVDAGYVFNPLFQLKAEFSHRFGNSPFGGAWVGPNAIWAQGTAGKSLGKLGNNYLDFGYINAGANSTDPHTEIEGTPDYQQFFINNPNGYNIAYVGLHHYFATNAQIGLILQGWGTFTNLPINYLTGEVATPGIITRDRGQAIFLETRLAF